MHPSFPMTSSHGSTGCLQQAKLILNLGCFNENIFLGFWRNFQRKLKMWGFLGEMESFSFFSINFEVVLMLFFYSLAISLSFIHSACLEKAEKL